jgi:hypothetical protein
VSCASARPRAGTQVPCRFCKDCGGSGLCEQHGRRRDRCKDCRCARAAADAQEKLPGKLRPQLAQPYAFQSVAQGALRLSTCTAAADAQEKAAAALAAVAALESETAAPAPAAAPAAECSECTFVSFC